MQIIQENRRPSQPSFGQQIAGPLGQALGQSVQGYFSGKQQQAQMMQENEAFHKLTGLDISGVRDPKMREKAFELAFGEQFNKRESERNYTNEMGKLAKKHEYDKDLLNTESEGSFENDQKTFNVIKEHFGEKAANIYQNATEGGKTKFLERLLEGSERGMNFDQMFPKTSENEQENPEIQNEQENLSPEDKQEQEIQSFLKKQNEGLLKSELVSRGKERYDSGIKQYQETGNKLRTLARDKERFDIIEDLQKSKKLPEDLARLNVDDEGNLRLPFIASPETQRFVKTLNEFSQGAKDTYGSRVTNFDLAQYLRRYPTLLNSPEGIRQIVEQMRIVNQINSVYYKNLKNVYDKSGGVRNIDADAAERFAEKYSENTINELSKKFQDIGKFLTKPSASQFKGKKIRDVETGEFFVSDGENWNPAE